MAEIIVQQSSLFLISMLYGVILGVWYDFFRAVRKKVSHRNRTVHMEDVVFCLSAAAGLFLLFQIYNQGRIRFYVLLGLFAGAVAYFFVLSVPVEKIMELIVGAATFLLGKAAGILFLPVKIIVNSISKRLKKLVRTVRIVRSRK